MTSINKHRIRQRVADIYDASYGSQGTSKAIKEYTRALEKQVSIHTETMGDADDFARDFGDGI